jgi:hypothetical protein
MRVPPNRRERIRNNRHKEINKPKIEYDDTNYKETTRDEELGVDHGIHEWGPLRVQSALYTKTIAKHSRHWRTQQ